MRAIPDVQARLLIRYLRGDLERYLPFGGSEGNGCCIDYVCCKDSRRKTRIRKVAKQCVHYGRRVYNLVFECVPDRM